MATYAELKELSQHMDRIDDSVFMGFDIEGMPNHLPRNVRRANDAFVAANKDVPGVMDYDTSGFTEPEDEHDCFINNQALTRLPEVMPYLEKLNKYVKEGGLEDSKYSMYTLHLGAKILNGKDKGLDDEQIDYLCKIAGEKDLGYFGCYKYSVENVRGMMREGEPLARIKMLESMKEENDQSVNFYRNFCDEVRLPKNDEAMILIGSSANMGVSYGLQEALTDDGVSLKDAKAISECMDMICAAELDPKLNVKYVNHVEHDDGTTSDYDTSRFHTFAMEHYVEDITKNLYAEGVFKNHPESLKTLVKDFVNDTAVNPETGVPLNNCISAYYGEHKDKYDKILSEEKVPTKECELAGTTREFTEPNYFVRKSMFDDSYYVSSDSHRLGMSFNIELSNELADKLGVYHDEEFKPNLKYTLYYVDDFENPEDMRKADIQVATGVKRVDDIEREVGPGREVKETIVGSHMENEYTRLGDCSKGEFTQRQVDGICSAIKDVMSESYPGFTVEPDALRYCVPAPSPEKAAKDRTKTVEAEFGGIQGGAEASIDSPNFK